MSDKVHVFAKVIHEHKYGDEAWFMIKLGKE